MSPMASDQPSKPQISPFFYTPPTIQSGSLAVLHLKRDSLLPLIINPSSDSTYAEGAVTNTRFGSFPHSTLIDIEWGSQVGASKVDTGSRGRKAPKPTAPNPSPPPSPTLLSHPKRKASPSSPSASPHKKSKLSAPAPPSQTAKPSPSGFLHILPPTPETWTSSLDHRTQVVYTPDSSYILSQLCVRPGDSIIEAGAGSGSFTHAAARAIFTPSSGYVFSFEYHRPRFEILSQELSLHGLLPTVQLTHRDVCNEGFTLPSTLSLANTSPVTAVFLDLPAPWLAIPHLSRGVAGSPLSRTAAVKICTFSPCIEQVMATTAVLRRSGWTGVRVVEVANRRVDVRRERVGFREEGLRGVQASAADVEDAVTRLREVERRFKEFNGGSGNGDGDGSGGGAEGGGESKQARLERIRKEAEERKLYKEGRLVHRTEPDIRTHTSYLVFAVLPREWGVEDEKECEAKWGVEGVMKGEKGQER